MQVFQCGDDLLAVVADLLLVEGFELGTAVVQGLSKVDRYPVLAVLQEDVLVVVVLEGVLQEHDVRVRQRLMNPNFTDKLR
jgi:hypothetical protein